MGVDFRTLLILLLIALVLFGAKKLPDLARSVGRSARILKAETKGFREDEEEGGAESAESATPTQNTRPQASQQESAQPQQQSYPELPPGRHVVDENGEPVRRTYGS